MCGKTAWGLAPSQLWEGASLIYGHHSSQSKAAGFCILNSVSIGANYLLKKYKYKKFYNKSSKFEKHKNQKVLDVFFIPQK